MTSLSNNNSQKKKKSVFVNFVLPFLLLALLVLFTVILLSPSTTLNAKVFHEDQYKAYCCAKDAAEKNMLYVSKFPAYKDVKFSRHEQFGEIYTYIDRYHYEDDFDRVIDISGTMICENAFKMEMNVRFTATIICLKNGECICYSFETL